MITGLKVVPGDGTLSLTWTNTTHTTDNAIIVKWQSGSGSWANAQAVELPIFATNYTITGLTNYKNYTVQVSSVHFSSPVLAVGIPSPLPVPSPGLRVAVCNVAQRNYIPGLVKEFHDIGVHWDRDDVGDGTDLSRVTENLALGFKSIVLYNPNAGDTPANYASQVKSLATRILAMGLTEIEFVNEPDLNGWTAAAYAAAYAAAHQAIQGMGITLIAYATGDYIFNPTTWSKDAAGGGWIHDFIAALPGGIPNGAKIIDAWACHPYGPVVGIQPADGGWAAVANRRAYAVQYGSSAPWYITEVGQRLNEVSLDQQAIIMTQYLNDLRSATSHPGTPYYYIVFWSWYEAIDDTTGQWGLVESDGTPRPSFNALKTWIAAHQLQLA